MNGEYQTIGQLAQRIGANDSTVRKLVVAGHLPSIRTGAFTRVLVNGATIRQARKLVAEGRANQGKRTARFTDPEVGECAACTCCGAELVMRPRACPKCGTPATGAAPTRAQIDAICRKIREEQGHILSAETEDA